MERSFKKNTVGRVLQFWLGIQPWHALIILVAVNLILGFFIGNQYGQTWDEPSFYLYGERSYEAFALGLEGSPLKLERHIFFLDLRYYGPVYTAGGWKIVELLTPILKHWGYMDIWHLVNFVFFQTALVALYLLAQRFMRPWMAFFTTFLFSTQPLIFGHAFINPKDIPFMTFFLASMAAGFAMSDEIGKESVRAPVQRSFPSFSFFIALLFGLFAFTFIGRDLIQSVVEWVISSMYNAPADSSIGKVFSLLAGSTSRLPLENYVHKAYATHLERLVLYFLFILVVGRKLYLDYARTGKLTLPINLNLSLWGLVLLAGIVLGLATSIRLLAPFAGLLIVLYSLKTNGRASLPALIVYFSVAGLVTVITWPFLWDSPSLNFLEALHVMRDFPFGAEVRFMGDNITPDSLPWYYLPVLVSIQLTIPAVLLAWLGTLTIFSFIRESTFDKYAVILAWFFLPVGAQIVLSANAYDNFRQFLFILPPLFILAGIGFETLLLKLNNHALRFAICTFCLLPGIAGIAALHPVQYIYYNGFVGGVAGAEGNFELDYWLTSYRLAAPYINENAAQNANILAWGSGFNGTRDDLDVYGFASESSLEGLPISFEYAVLSTRFDSHLGVFPDALVVFEVKRGNALLAVVKKLMP